MVINRRQTSLSRASRRTLRCSLANFSRKTRRAASKGSIISANSGTPSTRSWIRCSKPTTPTIPTFSPKLRNKPRISFSIARAFSWSIFRAARSALRFWLASVLTCTGRNKPTDSRTDRGRAIDTRVQSELVSSIVPRGTSLRWIVVLSLRQFGVRRSDCRRHFPCPAELGSITPHAMHNHGEPPCQCDDGFFLPPTLGNVHRPCLQPRPFLHAGQHDLRGLIEQRSHGLVAT